MGHLRPSQLGAMVIVAVALSRVLRLTDHSWPLMCAGRWQTLPPSLFYRRFPLLWQTLPPSLFCHRFPLWWRVRLP